MLADGYASSNVYTWLDTNENGLADPGELPLPDVEISYPNLNKTNKNGQARTGVFKPGCACRCWKDEYVEVVVPDGYRATTPTKIILTSRDANLQFGFKPTAP